MRQRRYNVYVLALTNDRLCHECNCTLTATVHSVWWRHRQRTVSCLYCHCSTTVLKKIIENGSTALNDGQPTATERRQNRNLTVRINPPSTSNPTPTSSDRQHYNASCIASPRPRGPPGRGCQHVTATVRESFSALRQIRSVRRSLPRHALLTLIRALVVTKVDYCSWLHSTVGRTQVFDRRTDPVLRSTCSWRVTTMWVNRPL